MRVNWIFSSMMSSTTVEMEMRRCQLERNIFLINNSNKNICKIQNIYYILVVQQEIRQIFYCGMQKMYNFIPK